MKFTRLTTASKWLCILFGICLAASHAWAQNFISGMAWMEDLSGQMTLNDVKQSRQFVPFEGVLSRGYGDSPIWIRLRIDPMASIASEMDAQRLYLKIRPVYLDEITIHDPMGREPVIQTGDRIDPKPGSLRSLDFVVPIARGDQPRLVWIQLKTNSTRQILIEAQTLEVLNQKAHLQELTFSLYIGFILVIFCWALLHWLLSREALMGAFALSQGCALIYAICTLGYARAFWPGEWDVKWLDALTSIFSVLGVSSAVWFHVLHILEYQVSRMMRWLCMGWAALLLVKLSLLTIGQTGLALHLNMIEVLISPIIFWLVVLGPQRGDKAGSSKPATLKRNHLIGFYTLLMSLMLLAALPGLGLMAGGEIPLYIVQAHGLFTALLIMAMLQYRDRVLRKQQYELVLSLKESQLQVDQEKASREEQGKLLAMLAHELKTPLSVMHMRLDANMHGSKEIISAIRDMNMVIERCTQALQLSDKQLKPEWSVFDLVTVIQDCIRVMPDPTRIHFKGDAFIMICSDRQLIVTCLQNMVENAFKYSPMGAPIEISAHREPGRSDSSPSARIDIRNQPGPAGRPDPERVFEKYYRNPKARRLTGTGLGLYLVKYLMSILGGHVAYMPESETVHFRMVIPVQ